MTETKLESTYTTYCGSPRDNGYTANFYAAFMKVNLDNPNMIFWLDEPTNRLYIGVLNDRARAFEMVYSDAFSRTGEDYME